MSLFSQNKKKNKKKQDQNGYLLEHDSNQKNFKPKTHDLKFFKPKTRSKISHT